jgi:hypothetical protein
VGALWRFRSAPTIFFKPLVFTDSSHGTGVGVGAGVASELSIGVLMDVAVIVG